MAASCWRHQGSTWNAGKHLERAGECAKESGDASGLLENMKDAALAYRESGRAQTAAECLTKAAKWSEANNPEVSNP